VRKLKQYVLSKMDAAGFTYLVSFELHMEENIAKKCKKQPSITDYFGM
jgi:hypothetical protein